MVYSFKNVKVMELYIIIHCFIFKLQSFCSLTGLASVLFYWEDSSLYGLASLSCYLGEMSFPKYSGKV